MIGRVAGAILVSLVQANVASGGVARGGQPVMGTVLEVTVIADGRGRAQPMVGQAIAEARRWDDVLTTWRPEGELARLNAQAGSGPLLVSPELGRALSRMRELSAATGGAFDPAVGPLVRLWSRPQPPAAEDLEAVRCRRIVDALELGGGRASLVSGAELDAGGIGKGIALDAIAKRLRAGGVRAAFLDFGGSSQLAIGAPRGAPDGWRVAVAGIDTGRVHGIVRLRDRALSTSRSSGAANEAAPIVDPRTGRRVAQERLVTVLAADATAAEAWSTALVVLGERGLDSAHAAGTEVFLETENGIRRTPGFRLETDHLGSTMR